MNIFRNRYAHKLTLTEVILGIPKTLHLSLTSFIQLLKCTYMLVSIKIMNLG